MTVTLYTHTARVIDKGNSTNPPRDVSFTTDRYSWVNGAKAQFQRLNPELTIINWSDAEQPDPDTTEIVLNEISKMFRSEGLVHTVSRKSDPVVGEFITIYCGRSLAAKGTVDQLIPMVNSFCKVEKVRRNHNAAIRSEMVG